MRRALLIIPLLSIAAIHGADLKNVEYGRAGSYSLRFDGHIPDGKGPFPAAILVHGGAWVTGDRTSVEPLFAPLSAAGFAWFSISYRLVGDVLHNPVASATQLGMAEDDVRHAVVFVRQHAAEYRLNPDKIALIGESAGGQLAAMAALRPDPDGAVQAVVAFYSPTDLASLVRTSNFIPEGVRDAVKGTTIDHLLMAGLTEVSPVHYVSDASPPFLLIHGTDDGWVPFAQSQRFCEKLQAAGAKCDLYPVKGGGHGMKNWDAQHLTGYKGKMVEWLTKTLATR